MLFATSEEHSCSTFKLVNTASDALNNGELVGVVRDYGYGYGDHYLKLIKNKRIKEAVTNSESSNLKSLSRG